MDNNITGQEPGKVAYWLLAVFGVVVIVTGAVAYYVAIY
jgi:hypothetical protein